MQFISKKAQEKMNKEGSAKLLEGITVVNLAGPKQSGKDTAARFLKKAKKIDANVSFADPLKHICMEVFGLHRNLVYDADLKELPLKTPIKITAKHMRQVKDLMIKYLDPDKPGQFYNAMKAPISKVEGYVCNTPRFLLQVIGTEFIRHSVWDEWHIRAAFSEEFLTKRHKGLKVQGATIAVTDCRFINEFDFLNTDARFTNTSNFYVLRGEAEEKLAKDTHASEQGVVAIREDIEAGSGTILDNNGTLKEFEKLVKGLFDGRKKSNKNNN